MFEISCLLVYNIDLCLYNVKLISNMYTSIEDMAKAGSESEGEPTLSKHLQ